MTTCSSRNYISFISVLDWPFQIKEVMHIILDWQYHKHIKQTDPSKPLCFLKLFSTINGINQKNRWTKLTFQTPPWSWRRPWCPSSDRWAAHPAGLCGRHSQPSPTSCRDCHSASPSSCQNQTMVESTLYNHTFDLHTLRIFKFIYIFLKNHFFCNLR